MLGFLPVPNRSEVLTLRRQAGIDFPAEIPTWSRGEDRAINFEQHFLRCDTNNRLQNAQRSPGSEDTLG